MLRTKPMPREALDCAARYFRHWTDPFTKNERDDLVQETAIAAWRSARGADSRRRLDHLVRTIARRLRYHAIYSEYELVRARGNGCDMDALPAARSWRSYDAFGASIPRAWMLACVNRSVGRLASLNRGLLMGFYEGFSCAELAFGTASARTT